MDQSGGRSNGTGRGRRDWIAVVDDDPSIRSSLARLLDAEGFVVDTFSSSREFLTALADGPPACLVLDVHLGSESGFDLQDRLAVSHRGLPVILMTGHDRISTAELVRRAGKDGFARKPFDGEEMIEMIRRRTEMVERTG